MDATFDPRPMYQAALTQLAKLFAELSPELLDRPTPCSEFDLRALLSHTVGGIHRIAYVGEGGRALDLVPAVAEVADDAWAGALERAAARATAAWAADEKLDRLTELPWGEAPGRIAVSGYVMEAVTHSWDIARAIGSELALDEQLAEFALGFAAQALPAERRGGPVPFGVPVEVPADVDATTRLAGWLGRAV